MGEPSSRTHVTPDMDQHPDPEPGCTASGRPNTQETLVLSTRGDPVTQATDDTGGPEAFAPRIETGIRSRIPRHVDSLNEPCLTVSSDRDQRPAPKEVEEDASTKNSQKRKVPFSENSSKERDKPPQVVNVPTRKAHKRKHGFSRKRVTEDTGYVQNISTEDIPTSVDQVPLSENSSRERDKPPQVVNVPTKKAHKRKHGFSRKRVTEDTGYVQNISTEDIPTSVDQVPLSENSSRERDKPPQVVNISTKKAHKRKFCLSRKRVTEETGYVQNISTEDIPTSVDQVPLSENSSRERDKPPQVVNIPTKKAHKRKFGLSRKRATEDTEVVNIPTDKPCKWNNVYPGKKSSGALVRIRRWRGTYYHYGIYVVMVEIKDGVEVEVGYLVHRTGGRHDLSKGIKGKIRMEKIEDVIKPGDYVLIENGSWNGKEPLPTEEIIKRAISQIGKEGFHLFNKNCEHFARWCRYGEAVSEEANNLLFILQSILLCYAKHFQQFNGLLLH